MGTKSRYVLAGICLMVGLSLHGCGTPALDDTGTQADNTQQALSGDSQIGFVGNETSSTTSNLIVDEQTRIPRDPATEIPFCCWTQCRRDGGSWTGWLYVGQPAYGNCTRDAKSYCRGRSYPYSNPDWRPCP